MTEIAKYSIHEITMLSLRIWSKPQGLSVIKLMEIHSLDMTTHWLLNFKHIRPWEWNMYLLQIVKKNAT